MPGGTLAVAVNNFLRTGLSREIDTARRDRFRIASEHGGGDAAERLAQFGRSQDFGVRAAGENAALDIDQVVEALMPKA